MTGLRKRLRGLAIAVLSVPVHAWRWIGAPLLGPHCRYAPSCSAYALEALAVHGPIRGMGLALARIARCHPWGGHGFDPVPGAPDPSPPSARPR